MSEIVTKAQLARTLNVSPQMISKYVSKGVLSNSFVEDTNKKKLYLDKALSAIANFKTREPSHNSKNKTNEKVIKKVTTKEIKKTKDIYTDDNLRELSLLLLDIDSPKQKVDTIEVFWRGKVGKIKYDTLMRDLVPVDDAKIVLEAILTPLNQYLDDLAHHLKANFTDEVTDEMIRWINAENNRAKTDIGKITL